MRKQLAIKDRYLNQLLSLTEHFDSSFYFYDLDGLQEHFSSIQDSMFDGLKLWYATKANPLSNIIRTVRDHGFGIDVASQGELDQATISGFDFNRILSTGPSKSRKYLKSLVKHQINMVVCESLNQVKWLNQAAKDLGVKANALLRVQLEWEEGESVLGGQAITPFGINPGHWKELTAEDTNHLNIKGFHVFQWGNILEVSRLKEIWWKICEELKELENELNVKSEIIDLGGGLGIRYDHSGQMPQFNEVARELKALRDHFEIPEIWMELGRYFVGPYGVYLTQIIDRKEVRGKTLLITDGGINHIARPALTNESFPCDGLNPKKRISGCSEEQLQNFQIHGPLCTALDKLGEFDLHPDLRPGDWLVFSQAGAYGMTESMPYFLCHNLPAEVIIKNGETQIVRPVQTSARWLV